MSRNARPHYRPGRGWILGVAFVDTLTRPVRLAQGFTFVRCHGSPRASSPHGLTAPGLASLDGIAACSCLWLEVATNSPREGLSPPIQCPCQAHLRPSFEAAPAPASVCVSSMGMGEAILPRPQGLNSRGVDVSLLLARRAERVNDFDTAGFVI